MNISCDDIAIKEAVTILNEGGVIIFPTDTAFGIGCRIDKFEAVKKVFAIRKRPQTQATPVLVADREMAQGYAFEIPEAVSEKLIKKYWPGALTIILQANEQTVPPLVRGGGNTVGLRQAEHVVPTALCQQTGVGILAPSANFHGEKTPYTFEELDTELMRKVDYVIPGVCEKRYASTVIDCVSAPWRIVRQGALQL